MKKFRWLSVIFALCLSFGMLSSAQAQDGASTIHGLVYNGTEGAELPENLPITLYVYTGGNLTGTYETTADSSGAFAFEQVDLVSGDLLVAFTEYMDVTYTSASFTYDSEAEIPDFSIAIYETTEDVREVAITQMTLMLSVSDGQLRLGEYYLLGNLGDRTWVGTYDDVLGMNTTTAFSLPPEAQSLWFSGAGLNERFFGVENDIVDTAPIVPGYPSAEIFFSYAVPYSGSFAMSKNFNLPVGGVEYLIAKEDGIAIEGNDISYSETIETDTESAISYLSPGFEAGQILFFRIYDQSAFSLGAPTGLEIGIGLFIVALAGGGIFWMLKRSRKVQVPAKAEPLLVEIAHLDDEFASGNLKKAQYQKERNALVERIKRM